MMTCCYPVIVSRWGTYVGGISVPGVGKENTLNAQGMRRPTPAELPFDPRGAEPRTPNPEHGISSFAA